MHMFLYITFKINNIETTVHCQKLLKTELFVKQLQQVKQTHSAGSCEEFL